MDERVKELYKQASKQEYFLRDGEEVYMSAEDLKKFAELIVRECCEWIEGTPASEEGTIRLSKSFIIANIKGYFGVE